MKFVQLVSMYVAAFILMAHSIVPHEHLGPTETGAHFEKHQEATSFLDFLALGFHHQLDDSQLEVFIGGETQDLSGDELHVNIENGILLTSNTEIPFLGLTKLERNFNPTQWKAKKHVPLLAHRGPPSQLS